MVIPIDADWKSYFDMIMLLCACENTIMQAYYSAFGLPNDQFENILDFVIEGLFLLDLIFCLCQEYRDSETQTMVTDLKKISINYLKGNFLFDLIAIIPFDSFTSGPKIRLYRLLKMLRVPRMIQLLDVDRVKALINNYYQKRLKRAVAEADERWKPPILQSLLSIQLYKVVRLALIILISSYFIGIVWFISVCDVLPEHYNDDGSRAGFA